jgi:hypothetical protein
LSIAAQGVVSPKRRRIISKLRHDKWVSAVSVSPNNNPFFWAVARPGADQQNNGSPLRRALRFRGCALARNFRKRRRRNFYAVSAPFASIARIYLSRHSVGGNRGGNAKYGTRVLWLFDVSGIQEQGKLVQVTVHLKLFNHSDADARSVIVTLMDSSPAMTFRAETFSR